MSDEQRARYLESGTGEVPGQDKLDLIRSVLNEEATWVEPPEGIFEAVSAAIETQPAVPAVRERRLWPAVAALGAVAAVVILVVGMLGLFSEDADPDVMMVAMSGTDLAPEAKGTAAVLDASSGWRVRLEVEGLGPAPNSGYYEGWMWNDAGEGVSIGTFHLRGGDYPVILWSGVDVADYPWIWITLQDVSGGAEASDRVMMRGRVNP